MTPEFWKGRRVLVTGHTGFKGAWLTFWLAELGAEIYGLALPPEGTPNLHDLLHLEERGRFVLADLNAHEELSRLLRIARPEVIIHMAAQALVRRSYAAPMETFATNVLGTLTLLNSVRACPDVRAVIVVTSDKVYENLEWAWGYRETDGLGGHDPYSASKGCVEIATASMRRSFFSSNTHSARIATVRCGNVIGGGDWSPDRLVPDIVRGCLGPSGVVRLRNPQSVRPWLHVLESLSAYLTLAEKLCLAPDGFDETWNIGPDLNECRPVRQVAEAIINVLGRGRLEIASNADAPHEAGLLTLDCSKARARLGWRSRLDFQATIAWTAEWYSAWARGEDVKNLSRAQIRGIMRALA